jgi:hypothetical protein
MKELGDLLTTDEIARFVKIMDKDNNGVVEVSTAMLRMRSAARTHSGSNAQRSGWAFCCRALCSWSACHPTVTECCLMA